MLRGLNDIGNLNIFLIKFFLVNGFTNFRTEQEIALKHYIKTIYDMVGL